MLTTRSLATLVCVAAATLMGGCANPILAVDAPGYSLARSAAPEGEPQSMAEAIRKLNHIRASYYEAIRSQTEQAQGATTGLVWLGALVVGLAAGDAHRDAILGATLVGGTTYALARTQLDARRLQVWNSGIDALDCAKEATLPLNLGEARRTDLRQALDTLRARRTATSKAIDDVNTALASLSKDPSDSTRAAKEAVDKASAALSGSDRTIAAALALLESSNGAELSAAVDRIHAGVTKAMTDIAIDPKMIPQLVAGIGGFASVFAPGAGLDTALGGVFDKYKALATTPRAGAQAAVLGPLTRAIEALETEVPLLSAAEARTRGLLKDVNVAQVSEALKKCSVAGVITPIALDPESLSFDEGKAGSKGFTISGGTPPYVVTMLDAAPDALSIVFSGGLADSAQVKVSAAVAAGEYRVQVSDSGPVRRSKALVVNVAKKSGGGGAGVAEAKGNATNVPRAAVGQEGARATSFAQAWQALIAAMKKPGFSRQVGDVTFSVTRAEMANGKLQVTLQCSRADAGLSAADVREQLSTADQAAKKKLLDGKALDRDLTQIDLTSSEPCVKL